MAAAFRRGNLDTTCFAKLKGYTSIGRMPTAGCSDQNSRTIYSIPAVTFTTLLLLGIQVVFSNLHLGIALGALEFAKKYTSTSTRAWAFGEDRFYVLERYGFFLHI
jgi:hypothetical protein